LVSRAIDSCFVPAFTNAWFAAFPRAYIVPVATIVPTAAYPPPPHPAQRRRHHSPSGPPR
jgi:hypothetical protein